MPIFEIHWMARGYVRVEADDQQEASEITADSLEKLDSSMFENVDVDEVSVLRIKEE